MSHTASCPEENGYSQADRDIKQERMGVRAAQDCLMSKKRKKGKGKKEVQGGGEKYTSPNVQVFSGIQQFSLQYLDPRKHSF